MRAVHTPVSSLWAELLPSEPELDELELSELQTPGGRTSPALTLSSLEAPRGSLEGAAEPMLDSSELALEQDRAVSAESSSASSSASQRLPSDEFGRFEALDDELEAPHGGPRLQPTELHAVGASSMQAAEPSVSSASERVSHSAEQLALEEQLERGAPLLRHSKAWSVVATVAVVALLLEILTTTPLLAISSIELSVRGEHITEREVHELLRQEGAQQNILTFDLQRFKDRLEGLSWVRKASVARALPDQLQVTIEEHQAVGVVVFRQLHAVNAQGELLAQISPSKAKSLPLISGVPEELFHDPKSRGVGRFLIQRGLRVAELYHELELDSLRPLSEVHVSETGYVELILNRARVTLGKGDFERHLEDLRGILSELKRKGVDAQYILLSADFTRAIVKEVALRVDEEGE